MADLRFSADNSFKSSRNTRYYNAMVITDLPLQFNVINITLNTDPQLNSNILTKQDAYKTFAPIYEVLHAEMYRKMLYHPYHIIINATILSR